MGKNRFKKYLGPVVSGIAVLVTLFSLYLPAIVQTPVAVAAVQEKWEIQLTGPRRLTSVFFYDLTNGWAAGDGGTVVRTRDGGVSWTYLTGAGTGNLRGVFFVSKVDGWVVGDNGYIGRTYDGGDTWTKLESGTPKHLNAVKFRDIRTGWVIGDDGVIMRTDDGGATWVRQVAGTSRILHSLVIVDANNLWVTGDGGMFVRSSDGGTSWTIFLNGAISANLGAVSFSSLTAGWAIGSAGNLIQTSDGGASWIRMNLPTTVNLNAVAFTDVNNGWIIGDDGVVLGTKDGGKNWEIIAVGTTARLNGIYFGDKNNAWVVGDTGTILKYTRTETFGPTRTSLTQDLDDSGRVIMTLRIEGITDPKTGLPRQAVRGLAGATAGLNYQAGFVVLDFRGLPPFDKPDIRVNNVSGITTYQVMQRDSEPQPPVALGRFNASITGPITTQYTVSVNFSSIAEGGGGEIPQVAPLSLVFRRGDANGDGTVDSKDINLITQFLAGKVKKEDVNLVNAASVLQDSPDGVRITIKDAMFLAQKVAGVRDDQFQPASAFWADMLSS